MKASDNKKVRIIKGQSRLYRSPEIKTKTKKRSRSFDIIPISSDEKKQKEPGILDRQWEVKFFELQKFKKRYGHCDVPITSKNKQYQRLARWCQQQRKLKKFNHLKYNPDRLRKLNKIGFSWSILDKLFQTKFRELEQFQQKYGHCNVSRNPENKQYYSLAAWCNTLRVWHKLKPLKYSPDKVKRLNELGFAWSKLDEKFERKFSILKEYHAKHGHCYVRKAENLEIACWCSWLRVATKKKNISPEKIQRLNELGFPWRPEIRRVRWDRQFAMLEEYKKKHGHCDVSGSKADKPYRHLLYWVVLQREQYHSKNNHLTPERIKKLNDLGFKWINPIKRGTATRIDDNDLLYELKRLNSLRGKPPSIPYIDKCGKYSTETYYKHFGSMAKAHKAAGIGPVKTTKSI